MHVQDEMVHLFFLQKETLRRESVNAVIKSVYLNQKLMHHNDKNIIIKKTCLKKV